MLFRSLERVLNYLRTATDLGFRDFRGLDKRSFGELIRTNVPNLALQSEPQLDAEVYATYCFLSQEERIRFASTQHEYLLETLQSIRVGTYFLELCTPRAGEWEVLRQLPADCRIGVGMLNPKSDYVEKVSDLTRSIERAVALFGFDRVLLNPDCGFATFADNPVNSAEIAEAKLTNLCRAAASVRGK